MLSRTGFAMLWVIDREGQRMYCVFLAPLQGAICFLGGDLPMTSSWAGMSRPFGTGSAESENVKV